MRLIPAIDLRAGRCVRLRQGDFAVETRYAADPARLLAEYGRLGADWLHVVDLDRARDGGVGNRALVAALLGHAAELGIQLQVGGGLRDAATVLSMLELGAARVVVGSAALIDPAEARRWLDRFGGARVALALDVRFDAAGTPCVATHGWQRQSSCALWDVVAAFGDAGLAHVLCTDVSRDGALSGPNIALYREAVRRHPDIAWQASGGVRTAADLHSLAACGVAAAISGKALLEKLIPLEELAPFLPNA